METIQIVFRLPPLIDGVGDYAFLLAKELRTSHDVRTVFVVCDPQWIKQEIELDDFTVHQLKDRTAEELLRVLAQPGMPTTVLLQYVGYGYAKRGCPVWLTRGLHAWKGRRRLANGKGMDFQISTSDSSLDRRLVTMFHEIYAFGPPWRSAFWTSPLQRSIAKRLLDSSDRCRTNTKMHAAMLRKLSPRNAPQIPVLPVFSNVGEPEYLLPLRQRKRQMLVFGSAAWRRKVYSEQAEALSYACAALRMEKIVDVGEPVEINRNFGLKIEKMGQLPAAEVSRRLSESMFGFLTYFDGFLAKSGIFAAYCAHGVLPILAGSDGCDLDGIREGREFSSAWRLQQNATDVDLQAVADNANMWYRNHSLKKTAANTVQLLLEPHTPQFAT